MTMRDRIGRFSAAGLVFLLVLTTGICAYGYSSVLSFGDSLSDNGTTALNGIPGDNYGFRRYSNGPVWVEYLAAGKGIPLFNMAYGGATSGYDNPAAYAALGNPYYLGATGLRWQVDEYASKHSAGVPADTIITIWAGGNDMFNNRSTAMAAANIQAAIQILYYMGGRTFIVPNLSFTDTDPYKTWKMIFDAKLAHVLANVIKESPGIKLIPLDLNGMVPECDFYDGTWMAQTYGPGIYLSYDGVHPTTEIHSQIAEYAAAAVPLPPTFYLLVSGLAGLAGIKRMRFRR